MACRSRAWTWPIAVAGVVSESRSTAASTIAYGRCTWTATSTTHYGAWAGTFVRSQPGIRNSDRSMWWFRRAMRWDYATSMPLCTRWTACHAHTGETVAAKDETRGP